MAAAANSSRVSLKLLIDTKGQRVLFAEAGKNAVDFLFHILTLPMGTVIRLLTKQQMVGCIANVYHSIENLSDAYINQPNQTKEILLKPRTPVGAAAAFPSPLLSLPDQDHHDQTLELVCYRCNNGYSGCPCGVYFSYEPRAICPGCRNTMSCKMTKYVAPPAAAAANEQPKTAGGGGGDVEMEGGGFVKGVVTYMVMDDLVVKPMSTISSIALLNTFNVKEVGALEEKVVDLGLNEALNLLKTSLTSKSVLTSVFLKNMGK